VALDRHVAEEQRLRSHLSWTTAPRRPRIARNNGALAIVKPRGSIFASGAVQRNRFGSLCFESRLLQILTPVALFEEGC
jgi:hypothetical protein